MAQRENNGMIIVKKLDMTNDLRPWEPSAKAFLSGEHKICCPLCLSGKLKATAVCGADRIGFLLLTCPVCGKSANFSRVKFPESIEADTF